MTPFTVFDPRTGRIIRSGTCQDHMVSAQAQAGESALPLFSDQTRHAVDLTSMTVVAANVQTLPPPDYRMKRFREYPPIGDQLDILWKEMQALPLTQEADAMLKRIQAVKAKYPKP